MKTQTFIDLPEDYALVLQQIMDSDCEEFSSLSEGMRLSRPRLAHIIHALQHKGLVKILHIQNAIWIQLSAKGRKLTAYIWPESQFVS